MEELPEPGEEAAEPVSAPSAVAAAGERISVHNFCGRLSEQLVHFHAMRLRDSLFLWDSIPASTLLFGDSSNSTSSSLAQKLASKTKKQIFVSYNIQNTDSGFILLVENRIKEEMTAFPDKF